jgi:hypothetical protein
MVDIYMPVMECRYVPFFADVLSIYEVLPKISGNLAIKKGNYPNS